MNAENRRTALNTLLAVPVGLLGGAIAGEVIGLGSFVAYFLFGGTAASDKTSTLLTSLSDALAGSLPFAFVGALIGVLAFPIAYAVVARTHNVLIVVAPALLATILSYGIGAAILGTLSYISRIPDWEEPSWFVYLIAFAFPVASMFWACAWTAARERRRIAG